MKNHKFSRKYEITTYLSSENNDNIWRMLPYCLTYKCTMDISACTCMLNIAACKPKIIINKNDSCDVSFTKNDRVRLYP